MRAKGTQDFSEYGRRRHTSACDLNSVVETFIAVIDAAVYTSVDRQKLVVLVQSKQASDDVDSVLSAPDTATYRSHGSDIIDVPTVSKVSMNARLCCRTPWRGTWK